MPVPVECDARCRGGAGAARARGCRGGGHDAAKGIAAGVAEVPHAERAMIAFTCSTDERCPERARLRGD